MGSLPPPYPTCVCVLLLSRLLPSNLPTVATFPFPTTMSRQEYTYSPTSPLYFPTHDAAQEDSETDTETSIDSFDLMVPSPSPGDMDVDEESRPVSPLHQVFNTPQSHQQQHQELPSDISDRLRLQDLCAAHLQPLAMDTCHFTAPALEVLDAIFCDEDPQQAAEVATMSQLSALESLWRAVHNCKHVAVSLFRILAEFFYAHHPAFHVFAERQQRPWMYDMASDPHEACESMFLPLGAFFTLWIRLEGSQRAVKALAELNLAEAAMEPLLPQCCNDLVKHLPLVLSSLGTVFHRCLSVILDRSTVTIRNVSEFAHRYAAFHAHIITCSLTGASAVALDLPLVQDQLRQHLLLTLAPIFKSDLSRDDEVSRRHWVNVFTATITALAFEELSDHCLWRRASPSPGTTKTLVFQPQELRRLPVATIRAVTDRRVMFMLNIQCLIAESGGLVGTLEGLTRPYTAGDSDIVCELWNLNSDKPLMSSEFWCDYVLGTTMPSIVEDAIKERQYRHSSVVTALRDTREERDSALVKARRRKREAREALQKLSEAEKRVARLQAAREEDLFTHAGSGPPLKALPEPCNVKEDDLEGLKGITKEIASTFLCSLSQDFIQQCPVTLRLKNGGVSSHVYEKDMARGWIESSLRGSASRDVTDPNSRKPLDITHPAGVFVQSHVLWTMYKSCIAAVQQGTKGQKDDGNPQKGKTQGKRARGSGTTSSKRQRVIASN